MNNGIFIANENPKSWMGDKNDNRGAKPEKKKKDKEVTNKKYDSRISLWKSNKETNNLIDLAHKIDDNPIIISDRPVGVAVCGSLPSMMSRLKKFVEQKGKVSVLIFVGHGNEDTIGTGSGHLSYDHEDNFKPKKREISTNNISSWKPTFQSVKDDVAEDEYNDCFNVFLLGCHTGEGKLPQTVASELKGLFKLRVAVFGQAFEGSAEGVMTILQKIDDILGESRDIGDQGEIEIEGLKLTVAISKW